MEPLYREFLAARRRLLGPRHSDTLVSLSNLGTLQRSLGRDASIKAIKVFSVKSGLVRVYSGFYPNKPSVHRPDPDRIIQSKN